MLRHWSGSEVSVALSTGLDFLFLAHLLLLFILGWVGGQFVVVSLHIDTPYDTRATHRAYIFVALLITASVCCDEQ